MWLTAARVNAQPGIFVLHDTATPEIYTLSLHDALPIRDESKSMPLIRRYAPRRARRSTVCTCRCPDRKSTRLNSSHTVISYAVFCLKKKKTLQTPLASHNPRPPACDSSSISDQAHIHLF